MNQNIGQKAKSIWVVIGELENSSVFLFFSSFFLLLWWAPLKHVKFHCSTIKTIIAFNHPYFQRISLKNSSSSSLRQEECTGHCILKLPPFTDSLGAMVDFNTKDHQMLLAGKTRRRKRIQNLLNDRWAPIFLFFLYKSGYDFFYIYRCAMCVEVLKKVSQVFIIYSFRRIRDAQSEVGKAVQRYYRDPSVDTQIVMLEKLQSFLQHSKYLVGKLAGHQIGVSRFITSLLSRQFKKNVYYSRSTLYCLRICIQNSVLGQIWKWTAFKKQDTRHS